MKLVSDAAKSGMGYRYMRSGLQCMLDEKMFDSSDEKNYSLGCD